MEQQPQCACEWTISQQKQNKVTSDSNWLHVLLFDLSHKQCSGIIKGWLHCLTSESNNPSPAIESRKKFWAQKKFLFQVPIWPFDFQKNWCKQQYGQLVSKSPIFKMVENHHGTYFHLWGQNSHAYNLCIVRKEILSGLILS